jgi:hypothetical protein
LRFHVFLKHLIERAISLIYLIFTDKHHFYLGQTAYFTASARFATPTPHGVAREHSHSATPVRVTTSR